MRRAGRIFGTYLLAGWVLCGCSILPTEEEFDAAPIVKEYEGNHYNKYTVTRGDMVERESIAVTYQGTKEVEITGDDGGGQIKRVCVQKGQKVKAGTVLLQEYLGDTEEQLKEDKRQIRNFRMQIRQSEEMKQRELEQLKNTGGTKEEMKNVRSRYDAQIRSCRSGMEMAELDRKEAQEEIDAAVTVSKIEGTVIRADHSFDGGYADQNTVLVKVRGEKKSRFQCTTKYAGRFKDGQEVIVTAAGTEYRTTVKKASGNRIYFYPKRANPLEDGAGGTVEILLKNKKDVLSLPMALVYDLSGKKVVYMEGENGVIETREVTLGETMGNMVEITGGLKENEQVVMN